MSAVEVRPVRTARERRLFLTFPWRIYRGDPLWVPPLLPERREAIDPTQSAFLRRGEAEFYIAWRGKDPVGTICAAVDPANNASRQAQDCVIGFFEYVDDEEVPAALLEAATEWARCHHLNALYGPFNLDYEDGYGVLVDGWDRPPAILCGHSRPYYRLFMERFGFEPARGQNLAFAITLDSPALQRLPQLADRVRSRRRITVRGANLAQWDAEIDRLLYLLQVSLAHLPDAGEWYRESVVSLVEPFRQIADPEMILFAEIDGKPVGWLPGVPNLNEAFIHVDGLRHPWDYAKLWWYMRRPAECLAIKSVLVPPAYWGSGIAVLLFAEMLKRATARGYKWADLSLTSDDNPNTPILAERLGARIYKRYQVYRLWI